MPGESGANIEGAPEATDQPPRQHRPQHSQHRGPQGQKPGGQPQPRGQGQGQRQQGQGQRQGPRHGPQHAQPQGRGQQPRPQGQRQVHPPRQAPPPLPPITQAVPPQPYPSSPDEHPLHAVPESVSETLPVVSVENQGPAGAPLAAVSAADSAALAPFAEDIEIEEPVQQVRRPTGREMLINVVEGEEVRIAVVRRTGPNTSVLEELYMERSSTESHIGNIYKGRVTNVEPSIQAAFVDFGIGKNGFLHISDLHPQYFPKKHQPRMPQQHQPRRMPPVTPLARREAAVPVAAQAVHAPVPVEPTSAEPAPIDEMRQDLPPESPVMAHEVASDAPAVRIERPGAAQLEIFTGPNAAAGESGNAVEIAGPAAPAESAAAETSGAGAAEAGAGPEDGAPQAESSAEASGEASIEAPRDAASAAESNGGASNGEETNGGTTNGGATNEEASNGDADFGTAYRAEFAGDEEFMDEYESESESDELDDGHMKPMEKVGRKTPRRERPPIQQCLRHGQEVIVQVTKEGIGTKGPTLTSYISCPGRYLVMMPGMAQLGVSRKIEDLEQRRELKRTLQELNPPKNLGFIIRTAGTEVAKKELQGDLNYLVRMWKVIANRIRTHKAPVELYEESDLVIRTIRDVFNEQIDRIIVDNEQVASRVRDFLSIVDPRSAGIVELYTGTMPVFQKYGVEREIEKINSRRVEMANGGSLVIDSTEALVAIDVNSGRYREMRDAELTAFNMNKEALKEVVRQLRLRDLGGVIVIDFIDMREERHKREIEHLLRTELENDRARTKVLRMSQFCMIELTRQRVRPSLKRSIYMDCPHCHGSALIKTPESVSLDAMRRLAAGATRMEVTRIDVRAYPSVATFLLNRKRKALLELEEKTGKRINITSDDTLAGDQIVLAAFDTRGTAMSLVL